MDKGLARIPSQGPRAHVPYVYGKQNIPTPAVGISSPSARHSRKGRETKLARLRDVPYDIWDLRNPGGNVPVEQTLARFWSAPAGFRRKYFPTQLLVFTEVTNSGTYDLTPFTASLEVEVSNVLTPDQLRNKQNQLEILKRKRETLGLGLAEAASHGGARMSKIPEYAALAEEIDLVERRIMRLEEEILTAEIVDIKDLPEGEAHISSRVTVTDLDTNETAQYQFGDPSGGRVSGSVIVISQTSPVGKAIIGKRVGDIVRFDSPGGKRMLRVDEISTT